MKQRRATATLGTFFLAALAAIPAAADVRPPLRLTVLYDNTAARPECREDWGFACLVEGAGKPILFDAGAKAEIFSANAAALGIDLSKIGSVVVSHAHGDHTLGLAPALSRAKGVPVYLPVSAPEALVKAIRDAGGDARSSRDPVEIAKDVFLSGDLRASIPEQALILKTSRGLVVLTGCSHPGIVKIVERAREVGKQEIYAVVGGFHLLQLPESDVSGIVKRFQDLGVVRVGPTHCTGDRAIEQFRKAFGSGFIEAGAGRVIELP